jgi:RHH-type proline utilization regulon transcriptional repressor/proline dehydrogenase/delta 1-pyrroline-5-carboxylate dehydrogenase
MERIAQQAIQLAAALAEASLRTQTHSERTEAAQMARMMDDPAGKAFTLEMVDRVFRSHDPRRQSARLRGMLQKHGVPGYLPLHQRAMLRGGAAMSAVLAAPVMAAVERRICRSSARVVLPGEPVPLAAYLAQRRAAGTRVNLNHLGEAILGEAEASQRLRVVLDHLANPQVNYVSVKISAIFSQINILDWDHTLVVIKDRLRVLWRAAMPGHKIVNLDMEEYRDLELTLAAFMQLLDEEEFRPYTAGIALQGYLPDSWAAQQRLTEWARRRVAAGGAQVKLRLVKGANLAMELVEAQLHGWNPAPLPTKADTDANFRRMLEYGCQRENAAAVRMGVASHNLFDLALAMVLRQECGSQHDVELEMLEGMANHQARAVQSQADGLLVYAPAVKREDFISALAYLVRRLDENTAPENYLHDLFNLHPGTQAWARQERRFVDGWEQRNAAITESRRAHAAPTPADGSFYNIADTDWTQPAARGALMQSIAEWRAPAVGPLGVLEQVLARAQAGQAEWESRGTAARAVILRRAAEVMQAARLATVVQMMQEGKKIAVEADVEVSEAVDAARYAAATAQPLAGVTAKALGVVVVTPPWNFPYAIPCGGVTSALAAGNSVILKPAPQTVGVAWHLAQHLWEAGVPRDVLQFFPCADGDLGRALISDPRVAAVVLTGAYETARTFLRWRPALRLYAETSGKNAIIITAQADRDLAIKDLVRSAFGHAGQKCSAASLAILEAELYDDAGFRSALRDAAASLAVGAASNLRTVVPPLIGEPGAALLRALTKLEPGESWLLQPTVDPADPCLWSPGIKLGVPAGGWFHQTECFGPVLGVMRADNLQDAIRMQNGTPFGLTAGIHSLDDAEIARWKEAVQVGNAYVNRAITGAVIRRQPFGGWKKSSMGAGFKAGGPNYVPAFASHQDVADAPEDYQQCWDAYFSREHDPSGLACESNVLRYRPRRGVILRLGDASRHAEAVQLATKAARTCGVPLRFSFASEESDAELAARFASLSAGADMLRTVETPRDGLLSAAYEAGINWMNAPLVRSGRIELPRWLREQAVSQTRHRYGLLSDQGDAQPRAR